MKTYRNHIDVDRGFGATCVIPYGHLVVLNLKLGGPEANPAVAKSRVINPRVRGYIRGVGSGDTNLSFID